MQTVLSMKDVNDAQTRTMKAHPGGITPLDTKLEQSTISNCENYARDGSSLSERPFTGSGDDVK